MKDREESIAYLVTQAYSKLTLGTTLFINSMPSTVEKGALIKEGYAGGEIDGYIPNLRKARFQIVVRGPESDYNNSKKLSVLISNALKIDQHTQVPDGIYIKTCRPLNEPISYQVSNGGLVEFSVNYQIIYFAQ